MREFVCKECGAKGIDHSAMQNKVFCSRRCYFRYYAKAHKNVCKVELPCVFNEGVACWDRKCESCGWNPEVAKKRMEALVIEEVEDDG